MTFLSHIRRERIVRMHQFFAGQHNAVTMKHGPCWIAVAAGNTHIKTSQEKKYKMRTIYRSCFVLDKTCLYKWCSSCLIFPCINGPNVTEKLDYTSVATGQRLVLAVVNSSDWDTDDHTQSSSNGKEIRKIKKLYNSTWGIIHDSLCGTQKDIGRVVTVGRLQQ